jgi:hypothetical protein
MLQCIEKRAHGADRKSISGCAKPIDIAVQHNRASSRGVAYGVQQSSQGSAGNAASGQDGVQAPQHIAHRGAS